MAYETKQEITSENVVSSLRTAHQNNVTKYNRNRIKT